MNKPSVVIAGGGFAGLKAARALDKYGWQVTLVTREPNFQFFPQLYHAATGGQRDQSSLPLAEILSDTGVKVVIDEVTKLEPAEQTVFGRSGAGYHYDQLILALGSVTNYFGIQGLEEYSYGIKSIKEAEEFKAHLHKLLVEEKRPDSHYVVIGAGPTGVELAGALPDYLRRIMRRHGITSHDVHIELVEAAPRVLPHSSEAVSAQVAKRLKSQGVNILTGVQVNGETATSLAIGNRSIESQTVVWTAGVANNAFFQANSQLFKLNKAGRVTVNEYLQAGDRIWVLGDNADTPYGGLAETAAHQGEYAARQIARLHDGLKPEPYHPKRPITVIPVGEHWAAVSYGELNWYGWLGWVLRRAADLIGYADVEPWPAAIRSWLGDRRQDNCPICDPKN